MKRNFLFSFSIFFLLSLLGNSSVFADIPIPQAKSVEIKATQNYPDFDFFYCEVPVTSTYDRGRHYTFHYENLTLKPVTFAADAPFSISQKDFSDGMYFLAVKKDIASNNDLKSKVADVLQNKAGDGVYFFKIDNSEDYSREDKNPRSVVYTVNSIDSSGIKTTREFADSTVSRKFAYVGIGLALTGLIVAIGIVFVKRSRK